MLGSAVPATATLHTSTSSATPSSPTRPSRLRGLSYLRNYTHNHLHPRSTAATADNPPPHLSRSTSSPEASARTSSPPPLPSQARSRATRDRQRHRNRDRDGDESTIQSGAEGWLPTVQGRSGLSRNPTSSTDPASPERSSGMTRSRTTSVLGGPAPSSTTSTSRSALRRQNHAAAAAEMSNTSDSDYRRPAEAGSEAADEATTTASSSERKDKEAMPTIRFIPHTETRSPRPSLQFTALSRTLKQHNSLVRVGRYSERDNHASPSSPSSTSVTPVGFKSKVVSRRHCEFWCTEGQWYVKDVKSSSGTFLNHVRLSQPNTESRPFPVNDGDVVQLGIDFKGGEEVIFRCVKIRIECNRGWQKGLNSFNTSAHKRLLKNAGVPSTSSSATTKKVRDSDAASTNSSECSICLNPVAPCQALFVAPCSHVWHYKCVRNLIQGPSWPNFLCPNCRFVADLEADVEPPEDYQEAFEEETQEEDEEEETSESQPDAEPEQQPHQTSGELTSDIPPHLRHFPFTEEHGHQPFPPNNPANNEQDVQRELLSASRLGQDFSEGPGEPIPDIPSSASIAASPATTSKPHTIGVPWGTDCDGEEELARATPTSTAPFALAAEMGNLNLQEGPMTPRNDAGPFLLLDGHHGSPPREGEGVGMGLAEVALRRGEGG